jgi:drug/metabolite transporter (DMT)-like permease
VLRCFSRTAGSQINGGRGGIVKALLAAVLFGVSAAIAKGLLDGAGPQILAGLLYLGSGTGLFLLWRIRRQRGHAEKPVSREDLKWIAGATFFGGMLGPVLLLIGLQRTAASTASLLLNLEGVFTAVLAWVVFRENADRRIVAGMIAIVIGGIFLSWQNALTWSGLAGPLSIAVATLCWGIDNNLTQRVSGSDPVQIAMLKGLVAGAVNLAIGFGIHGQMPQVPIIAGAMLLGFFSYGVSLILFIMALREVGTARSGAYFSLAPFIGALASFIIWRDPLTPLFAIGAMFMAFGLYLHLTEHHQHHHVHEPLTHEHRHTHDEHHRHTHEPGDAEREPHTHVHTHEPLGHSHEHFPDLHHRHPHQ